MRLAFVLLSPTFGMHQYTLDLARRAASGAFGGQNSDGDDVHVVTTASAPLERYGTTVRVHAPVSTRGTGFSSDGVRPGAVQRVISTLLALRPDCVHITGVHVWNLPLVHALRRAGVPTLHSLHDLNPHSGVRHAVLIRLFNRLIIASEAHLLVHGRCYRDALLASGVPPERVSYTPLLHGFWADPLYQPDVVCEPDHGDNVGTAVLFFGRIEPYKGVETLLDAWALLEPQLAYGQARLVLAGQVAPGIRLPVLPRHAQMINRRIGDEEGLALFRSAGLMVLPYRDGTQSAVIAAAYAFGRPVIVTRSGALPEYVVPEETGWIVPPANPFDLAQCLGLALANRSRLRTMGEAGRAWYVNRRAEEQRSLSQLYGRMCGS